MTSRDLVIRFSIVLGSFCWGGHRWMATRPEVDGEKNPSRPRRSLVCLLAETDQTVGPTLGSASWIDCIAFATFHLFSGRHLWRPARGVSRCPFLSANETFHRFTGTYDSSSIVGFIDFYFSLSQRLSWVAISIASLAMIVSDWFFFSSLTHFVIACVAVSGNLDWRVFFFLREANDTLIGLKRNVTFRARWYLRSARFLLASISGRL